MLDKSKLCDDFSAAFETLQHAAAITGLAFYHGWMTEREEERVRNKGRFNSLRSALDPHEDEEVEGKWQIHHWAMPWAPAKHFVMQVPAAGSARLHAWPLPDMTWRLKMLHHPLTQCAFLMF